MKFSELHRIILQHGWTVVPGRGKGSHLVYEKDGERITVPFHKGKEVGNYLAGKILKTMSIEI